MFHFLVVWKIANGFLYKLPGTPYNTGIKPIRDKED